MVLFGFVSVLVCIASGLELIQSVRIGVFAEYCQKIPLISLWWGNTSGDCLASKAGCLARDNWTCG